MSTDPAQSPEPADDPTENQPPAHYDGFAEAYAIETESNLVNAYYTRPAVLDLAGDVAGRRILDVGCGAGPLLAVLRERGALITGVDASTEMLELAKKRLGDDADLRPADLNRPLPFPDAAFDDAVACLVLHYLEDWTGPLAELRRVLVPGGRLIVVVNHPLLYRLINPKSRYFATERWADENEFNGLKATLTYWHRPLHAMSSAFAEAGFRIAVISEPAPAPEAYELFPEEFVNLPSRDRFLCFMFFVLEAV